MSGLRFFDDLMLEAIEREERAKRYKERCEQERAAAATPGPRRWEVNKKHNTVELSGGDARFDKSIMTFSRYGMRGASPVFWYWQAGKNWSHPPKRADALAVPFPGRDHHANWCASIDHPDARFMEIDPSDVVAICDENAALRARLAEAEKVIGAVIEANDSYLAQMPEDIEDDWLTEAIRAARAWKESSNG